MRLLRLLLAAPLLLAIGCGDDDASDNVIETTTSTTADDDETTTTTASTTTTAFDGATTPTSVAANASQVALLTDVQLGDGVVTFVFREGTPGADVGYVDPPILQDGSGEPIDVAGNAFLSVRMEPGSGVDLSGEEFEETYTGPNRIAGTGVIAEAVRTGDFEANLTWVIGLDEQRAYRVEADSSMLRVYFST
jgi:hypothetical protein